MSLSFLHSGSAHPAKGHDGLEHPVINALEKLTSTTEKFPGYFPFQGCEGEPGRSQHILLLLLALSVYKRNIAKCSVMMLA